MNFGEVHAGDAESLVAIRIEARPIKMTVGINEHWAYAKTNSELPTACAHDCVSNPSNFICDF